MDIARRAVAEFIGTFWLVLVGAGSAVLAARVPDVGIGMLGVAIAFGVGLTTIAYVIGGISGCHINPAVSLGLWAGGRMKSKDVAPYIVAQVVGAIVGALVLYAIASGKAGFDVDQGFAANGFGDHSPNGYNLGAALLMEVVLTFVFVVVIFAATSPGAPAGFAPLAIGLTLTAIHLVAIPVDNASVNPARSTGPALFVGGWALKQLWLFWVAPILGAILAGLFHRVIERTEELPQVGVAGG
jgi:aquaporin Z